MLKAAAIAGVSSMKRFMFLQLVSGYASGLESFFWILLRSAAIQLRLSLRNYEVGKKAYLQTHVKVKAKVTSGPEVLRRVWIIHGMPLTFATCLPFAERLFECGYYISRTTSSAKLSRIDDISERRSSPESL